MQLLTRNRSAWHLSAFYSATFGGFVAFSVYLPSLLKDDFGLTLGDAGFRTAVFAILATLMRPRGGMLPIRQQSALMRRLHGCGTGSKHPRCPAEV